MGKGERSIHPKSVTREELFRQVWETPMTRLALDYGVSGRGLAKICDRLNVPYPPRGHWAKKAAGRKVATGRLPTPDNTTPASIIISPTVSPPPPKLPQTVRQDLEKAQARHATVAVPERLIKPHPIISGWLATYRSDRRVRHEADPWRRSHLHTASLTPQDHRRHRLLNALFKELEGKGGKVIENERHELSVEISGERIEFQLREKQKQVRQPLSAEEKRFWSGTGREWKQILEGTGRLVFAIKTYLGDGLRREWLENDAAPMELLLSEIVATLMAAATVLEQMRREREEAQRLRLIEERKRADLRERQRLDNNRWHRFSELAQAWHTAAMTREFIAALKAMAPESKQATADQSEIEWIAWAEAHAQRLDPLTYGLKAIFEDVEKITAWTYSESYTK